MKAKSFTDLLLTTRRQAICFQDARSLNLDKSSRRRCKGKKTKKLWYFIKVKKQKNCHLYTWTRKQVVVACTDFFHVTGWLPWDTYSTSVVTNPRFDLLWGQQLTVDTRTYEVLTRVRQKRQTDGVSLVQILKDRRCCGKLLVCFYIYGICKQIFTK